jgi:hypothetical protein
MQRGKGLATMIEGGGAAGCHAGPPIDESIGGSADARPCNPSCATCGERDD